VFAMHESIVADLDARNVERAAQRRLQQYGYDALNRISCRCRRGTVTLKGTVSKYYHKQLAQEAVRNLRNVDVIVNEIRVLAK
jgi:osmotically-inducible protein OsmY